MIMGADTCRVQQNTGLHDGLQKDQAEAYKGEDDRDLKTGCARYGITTHMVLQG